MCSNVGFGGRKRVVVDCREFMGGYCYSKKLLEI